MPPRDHSKRLTALRARVRRALLRAGYPEVTDDVHGFRLTSVRNAERLEYALIVEWRWAGDMEVADLADLDAHLPRVEAALHQVGVNTRLAHDARSILVNLWDQH